MKSGYVSIVGEPNVGKSTLLNMLLGEKLAIVTPKPQTTRNRITGILTTDEYQIIFLDTPGMLKPRYKLQEYMVEMVKNAIADADLILYMIDVSHLPREDIEKEILDMIKSSGKKAVLVMNKIDLISKPMLLPLMAAYKDKFDFADIVPISALKNDGLDILVKVIVEHLPEGPMLFPPDQISDLPVRFFVGELIREKVFLLTRQEIPYASSVMVEEFKERESGVIYIRATIFVEKDSQKKIIIGKGGNMLKKIGTMAREELEASFGKPVYLELWVKVREKWRQNPKDLKELGYAP
ncbi:GTPase Era [Candidatus Poribacteria bacterium]|nr:MAG: GTPase Era [Candidatus Poribacteria bacterium]